MIDLNKNIVVQTKRGNIPLSDVVVGDVVYQYNSGAEHEVLDIVNETGPIYRARFNDRRIMFYTYGEIPFIRNMTPNNAPLHYGTGVVNPLPVDPYITGAFLTYGDRTDPYMNLPYDISTITKHLGIVHQLEYANELPENGRRYYRFKGTEEKIRWNQFFPNLDGLQNIADATMSLDQTTLPSSGGTVNAMININFFGRNESKNFIPLDYRRARISDRIKLVRGIFEMGYDKKRFPDDAAICHENLKVLREVQKILWSLGIMSNIEYNDELAETIQPFIDVKTPTISSDGGSVKIDIEFRQPTTRLYELYVVGKSSTKAGLYYNVESIENMLDNKFRSLKYIKFQLKIVSIREYSETTMRRLVFEKPNVSYLTDNFLPKISGKI